MTFQNAEEATPHPRPVSIDPAVLYGNAVLGRLRAGELEEVLQVLEHISFPAGAAVQREGDEGDGMYFVVEGTAEVSRGELPLKLLHPGLHFGELALLDLHYRAARITAQTPLALARLSREAFQQLGDRNPSGALHLMQILLSNLGEHLGAMADSAGMMWSPRSLPRRPAVTIRLEGSSHRVPTGTSVGSLMPSEVGGRPVLAALVNSRPVSLHVALTADATISPITLDSLEGRQIYRRSCSLLLLEAARRVAPDLVVRLGSVLSTGQVVKLDEAATWERIDLCARFNEMMGVLIAERLPFREELWGVEEARSYFLEERWEDAAAVLRTARETTVTLVSCGIVYALSGGPMLTDTGGIRAARVVPHPEGLLLDFADLARRRLPGILESDIDVVEREVTWPRFAGEMAQAHRDWLLAMGVNGVGAYNELCISGQVEQLVRVAEGFHEKQLSRIADTIAARRESTRVIAIAGPSSSGKTTLIKRLTVQLLVDGIRPVDVSLDDYYIDRERTPRDEAGKYDFESPEALDLVRFREDLGRLLNGERVRLPRFDFKLGKSLHDGGREIQLGTGNMLLLEGIHGLDPKLMSDVVRPEQIYSVFVHPITTLAFDRLTVVAASELRLLRRIVRDRHARGHHAADSIMRWPSVERGELRHIYPQQRHADTVFDSSLVYELSVLKVFAERYLLEVPTLHPAFPTAIRLRELLDRFVSIYPDRVPPTSVLREFIGGSGFEY